MNCQYRSSRNEGNRRDYEPTRRHHLYDSDEEDAFDYPSTHHSHRRQHPNTNTCFRFFPPQAHRGPSRADNQFTSHRRQVRSDHRHSNDDDGEEGQEEVFNDFPTPQSQNPFLRQATRLANNPRETPFHEHFHRSKETLHPTPRSTPHNHIPWHARGFAQGPTPPPRGGFRRDGGYVSFVTADMYSQPRGGVMRPRPRPRPHRPHRRRRREDMFPRQRRQRDDIFTRCDDNAYNHHDADRDRGNNDIYSGVSRRDERYAVPVKAREANVLFGWLDGNGVDEVEAREDVEGDEF